MNSITKRSCLILIILISLAVILYYFQIYKIQLIPLEHSSDRVISEDKKSNLILQDRKLQIVMLHIEDKLIEYYYDGRTTPRLKLVLNRMCKILRKHRGQIKNGTYFISLNDGVHFQPRWPVLSFATTKRLAQSNSVVLMPDSESLKSYKALFKDIDKATHKYSWHNKQAKILWRGATTGSNECSNFACSPRLKFVYISRHLDFIDAGFTIITLNLNKSFAQELRHRYRKEYIHPTEALQYKYLLDVDGNSCSYSRMAWILRSNSLLLKHQSDKIQWYYSKLKANIHFIPIAKDFSNLLEQYQWAESHPTEVETIIQNSQLLAQQVFNDAAIDQALINAFSRYHQICAMLNKDASSLQQGN